MKNDNYSVTYFLPNHDNTVQSFGMSAFHIFKTENGKDIIFKDSPEDYMALSEVFHSKACIMLGEPTVKNELASFDGTGGITSEVITSPEETMMDFHGKHPLHAERLYNPDETRQVPSQLIQNLNLEFFTKAILQRYSPEFINEFIRVWLTSNVFANTDTEQGNNIGMIIKDDEVIKMAPNYDFERAALFIPYANTPNRKFLQQGFSQSNIDYLKSNHKKVCDNYFERLLALRDNPKFWALCDFSGIEKFILENQFGVHTKPSSIENATDRLTQLSEKVEKGYKERFDMLLDQYSGK